MASVLPPLRTTPLNSPFGTSIYMHSCSSIADEATVRRYNDRSPSPASLRTTTSPSGNRLIGRKENGPPISSSGSTASLLNVSLYETCRLDKSSPPRRSWSWNVPGDHLEISSYDLISRFQLQIESAEAAEAVSSSTNSTNSSNQATNTGIIIPRGTVLSDSTQPFLQSTYADKDEEMKAVDPLPQTPERRSLEEEEGINGNFPQKQSSPFKRWLRALKKRHIRDSETNRLHAKDQESSHFWSFNTVEMELIPSRHKLTPSSIASTALITAVRTQSITMTSLSLYPKSRVSVQTSYLRKGNSKGDRQERSSFDGLEVSKATLVDDSTCSRSLQRHRIVEEMVSSEESYIRDLKTLLNVYLAVLPKNGHDRKKIQRSVSQILILHEELLGQLQTVLWDDDCLSTEKNFPHRQATSRHVRWHSMETSPPKSTIRARRERFNRHSIDTSQPSLIRRRPFMADTQLALNVAKIFNDLMGEFLVYEAYAAYKDLIGDFSATLKESMVWNETEKGIEAYSSLITSVESREVDRNKALALSDLIVKPIQRICKYPLFFRDLCKQTPACDDPVAHTDLQKVLVQLEEIAEQIDMAISNLQVRKRVEISWLLQTRLDFENKTFDVSNIFRKLGHVILCGVLHIVFPSNNGVKGHYLICLLYRSALILASTEKASQVYHVILFIPLLHSNIDTSNNGKGLQCHTAQFTWKLIFEVNRRQYEMLMSACSQAEEDVWKHNLRNRINIENMEHAEGRSPLALPTFVANDFKAIGPSYGPFLNFSRRLSIQRAATLGAKSVIQQVIIKNTEAQRYSNGNSKGNHIITNVTNKRSPTASSSCVIRSQSHNSSAYIPTLAPRRSERVKLEHSLADV